MQLLRSTSSAFLSGSLGAVLLKGSGVSKFYLQGQADSLALDLSGVSIAESAIDSGKWPLVGTLPIQVKGLFSVAFRGIKLLGLSTNTCLLVVPCQISVVASCTTCLALAMNAAP